MSSHVTTHVIQLTVLHVSYMTSVDRPSDVPRLQIHASTRRPEPSGKLIFFHGASRRPCDHLFTSVALARVRHLDNGTTTSLFCLTAHYRPVSASSGRICCLTVTVARGMAGGARNQHTYSCMKRTHAHRTLPQECVLVDMYKGTITR